MLVISTIKWNKNYTFRFEKHNLWSSTTGGETIDL